MKFIPAWVQKIADTVKSRTACRSEEASNRARKNEPDTCWLCGGTPGNPRGECLEYEKLRSDMEPYLNLTCGYTKAPEGWFCTRNIGHDGPCAAILAAPRPEGKP